MRAVRIAEDIVPISALKAQAATWLKRVQETDHPVVITQNGKAAGVLLSPAQFDALTERARFLAAIEEGLADVEAGRAHSHASVVARFKKK